MSETVDVAVIGAGVVGLAIARHLANAGRDVVVLEQADAIGTGISSRNSEVIHAGIYYPPGSLKAELCVRGRDMLYGYCHEHGVSHRRVGKLVVATGAGEVAGLQALLARGQQNGVEGLDIIDGAEAKRLEPALVAHAAMVSPATGIVDSHALMLSLQGGLEDRGGMVALNSPVTGGCLEAGGDVTLAVGGREPMTLRATLVVNAAGHGAWAVARAIEGVDAATIPPHHLAKGNYFTLSGKAPFKRLIYPLPSAAGLGVHYTLDLGGQGRFGPDVEWVEGFDYTVDPARADAFYAAIRSYWPDLAAGALQPAYAGIRPKIQAPGEAAQDFRILGPAQSGHAGLVQLFGIESPGLTASLAIARRVGEAVD